MEVAMAISGSVASWQDARAMPAGHCSKKFKTCKSGAQAVPISSCFDTDCAAGGKDQAVEPGTCEGNEHCIIQQSSRSDGSSGAELTHASCPGSCRSSLDATSDMVTDPCALPAAPASGQELHTAAAAPKPLTEAQLAQRKQLGLPLDGWMDLCRYCAMKTGSTCQLGASEIFLCRRCQRDLKHACTTEEIRRAVLEKLSRQHQLICTRLGDRLAAGAQDS